MSTENILMGALVAQIALAAVTWWPSGNTTVEAKSLIEGGANSITAFEITSNREDSEPVVLTADNGVWSITSEADYPADADKVAEVIGKLGDIKTRGVVASSATSHDKLKVSPTEFGRKVTLTANGTEQVLYISSAKSKTINLRIDGSDDVFEVKGLSEFDLKDSARHYWASNILDIDPTTLKTLTLKTDTLELSFNHEGGTWSLDGGPEGLVADSAKVDELAGKIMKLRLQEPVGKTVDPAFGLGRASFAWTSEEGSLTVPGYVELGSDKEDSNIYAKVDSEPYVVLVPGYAVKPLLEATVEDLTEPEGGAPTADAPPQGMPAGMPGGMPGQLPEGLPPEILEQLKQMQAAPPQ